MVHRDDFCILLCLHVFISVVRIEGGKTGCKDKDEKQN